MDARVAAGRPAAVRRWGELAQRRACAAARPSVLRGHERGGSSRLQAKWRDKVAAAEEVGVSTFREMHAPAYDLHAERHAVPHAAPLSRAPARPLQVSKPSGSSSRSGGGSAGGSSSASSTSTSGALDVSSVVVKPSFREPKQQQPTAPARGTKASLPPRSRCGARRRRLPAP
jgi:hypothetical protein